MIYNLIFLLILNIFYFIIALTLFLIDSASNMPIRYTFFSSNFACLFIYFPINLFIYMSSVLLYAYCLSLVFIDRLAKSLIFLSLFSRDLTLRA